MIKDFPVILGICITVIAGLMGFGWKLSEKVDSVRSTYAKDIDDNKSKQKDEARQEIESLFDNLTRDKSSKATMVTKMIDKVLELAGRSSPVKQYYDQMWASCSAGGRSLIYAGIFALAFPVIFYLYSDDLALFYNILLYIMSVCVTVLAAYSFLEVRDFIRNRDKLVKILGP